MPSLRVYWDRKSLLVNANRVIHSQTDHRTEKSYSHRCDTVSWCIKHQQVSITQVNQSTHLMDMPKRSHISRIYSEYSSVAYDLIKATQTRRHISTRPQRQTDKRHTTSTGDRNSLNLGNEISTQEIIRAPQIKLCGTIDNNRRLRHIVTWAPAYKNGIFRQRNL